jgi:hypothetical protein
MPNFAETEGFDQNCPGTGAEPILYFRRANLDQCNAAVLALDQWRLDVDTGIERVQRADFGFGAAKPSGGGYPAIYIYGLANGASVLGIYRSDDNAVTWNGPLSACPANITQFGSCPNNNIDLIKTVDGDANTYGRYYTGFSGTGFAYGN